MSKSEEIKTKEREVQHLEHLLVDFFESHTENYQCFNGWDQVNRMVKLIRNVAKDPSFGCRDHMRPADE